VARRPADSGTQWWIFCFFVLGVALALALLVGGKYVQRTTKSDETPLRDVTMVRSSSALDEKSAAPSAPTGASYA